MIVIINPNSTEAMTRTMVDTAAAIGIAVQGWTSYEGPAAIQGPADGEACIPPLLRLVQKASEMGADVIIIGCFDDTGLAQARALARCPVIGIGQAAYHMAVLAGPRFSVVTTLPVSVPILEDNIRTYGFGPHLCRVRASNVAVLALESDFTSAAPKVIAEIDRAVGEDGTTVVVLGCAGMTGIPAIYGATNTVRLIDGVTAACRIAVMLSAS